MSAEIPCRSAVIRLRKDYGATGRPPLQQIQALALGYSGRSSARNIGLRPVRPADNLFAVRFSGFQTRWAHRLKVYVPKINRSGVPRGGRPTEILARANLRAARRSYSCRTT